MKALTIKQPWAQAIAMGIKDVENRTWKTKYRGRMYIHTSADKSLELSVFTQEQILALPTNFPPTDFMPFSSIIGEVDIIDCVENYNSIWAERGTTNLKDRHGTTLVGKPIYNWVLANAKLYDHPISNIKGKLSFWEFAPEAGGNLMQLFKNFK